MTTRAPSTYANAQPRTARPVLAGAGVIVNLVPAATLTDEQQSVGDAIVAGYNSFALEWSATNNHDVDLLLQELDPYTLAPFSALTLASVSSLVSARYYTRFGVDIAGPPNLSRRVWGVVRLTLFAVAAFPNTTVRGTLLTARR